jgi:hypothetical protein
MFITLLIRLGAPVLHVLYLTTFIIVGKQLSAQATMPYLRPWLSREEPTCGAIGSESCHYCSRSTKQDIMVSRALPWALPSLKQGLARVEKGLLIWFIMQMSFSQNWVEKASAHHLWTPCEVSLAMRLSAGQKKISGPDECHRGPSSCFHLCLFLLSFGWWLKRTLDLYTQTSPPCLPLWLERKKLYCVKSPRIQGYLS